MTIYFYLWCSQLMVLLNLAYQPLYLSCWDRRFYVGGSGNKVDWRKWLLRFMCCELKMNKQLQTRWCVFNVLDMRDNSTLPSCFKLLNAIFATLPCRTATPLGLVLRCVPIFAQMHRHMHIQKHTQNTRSLHHAGHRCHSDYAACLN